MTKAGDNLFKIAPLLDWTSQDMQNYIEKFNLPNEMDYVDPTKGSQGRECGLHKITF